MATAKLPVVATAIQAIKQPIIHWREFLRFASIPIAINFFLALITFEGVPKFTFPLNGALPPRPNPALQILSALFSLASFIVVIPLEVAWIRLTLNGASSVADRPIWIFRRTEWRFLLATFLLGFVGFAGATLQIVSAIVPDRRPVLVVVVIGFAIFLVMAIVTGIVAVRLSFIFVELALDRFNGLRTSWNQTLGKFWRLVGIGFLAMLPYFIVSSVGFFAGGFSSSAFRMIIGEAWWATVMLAGMASSWSGLALAYKFTSPTPEADAAAAVTS